MARQEAHPTQLDRVLETRNCHRPKAAADAV
jgi:hypothetical protein